VVALLITLAPLRANAQAQRSLPERSDSWNTATNILVVSSAAFQLVMPRVFYSDPEVTVGWKARWHVSVLAPIMTIATVSLFNEYHLKNGFESFRPGCDETNQGLGGCSSYGMFSTHSFAAFAALGHGTGVFLSDTLKWSNGNFNAGALFGEVGVPLVLGIITAVGRSAGNFETGGQIWGSAGIGFGFGLGTGLLYALMQRPECGYSGSLICW
jgi:hypothetical protein